MKTMFLPNVHVFVSQSHTFFYDKGARREGERGEQRSGLIFLTETFSWDIAQHSDPAHFVMRSSPPKKWEHQWLLYNVYAWPYTEKQ